jgi:hypothetical protein
MKIFKLLFSFLLLLSFLTSSAQEARNQYLNERLAKEKQTILEKEREQLKLQIKEINEQLIQEKITPFEADSLKLLYAEQTAKEIEEKYLAKETELYQEEKKPNFETTNSKNTETIISYIKRRRDNHYLQSDLVFALGLNQLLEENILLEDTRFEFIKSWFAEVGWSWKTNIIPNSGLLNLRYGVSIQINSLSPKDNQVFYDENGQVNLRPYDTELNRNKLIYSNLVFPIHLELGSRRKHVSGYSQNGSYIQNTYNSNAIIIGAGFYGGFNIQSKLKLKGPEIKEKIDPNLNFNDLIYGVSGYVSLPKLFTLYGKIDLSTLFKEQTYLQQNISLGFRFDID